MVVPIGQRKGRLAHLTERERQTHMHVIGDSGVGKSSFLEGMIRADISSGHGVCVIDPHGELYENLVEWLASHQMHRYRKVHLLNPSDPEWSVGFNPLAAGAAATSARVGAMVNACVKVWGGQDLAQTPRLAKCLRLVFHALAEHRLSLAEAKKLTTWALRDIRTELTSQLSNPVYEEEWREFNEAYGQRTFAEMFESTNSRLLSFIGTPELRSIVGQTEDVLDCKRCMDEGHIVLVNLNGGDRFDKVDGQVLGAMLVSELYVSAKQRSTAWAKARPFYCYIDECADYLTEDVARMLYETRKFGLHLVLSHQELSQLREQYGEGLYKAIMAGAQTKVVFRCDDDETAEILSRRLFRKEFDMNATKEVMAKPVAVGQTPVWLETQGQSEGGAESKARITARGEVESETAMAGDAMSQAFSPEGHVLGGYNQVQSAQEGTGRARTASEAEAHGAAANWSRSWGEHQSLKTDYEMMPGQLKSMEEHVHDGIVAVRSLPDRTALVQPVAGKPFEMTTRPVAPALANQARLDTFCLEVARRSYCTSSSEQVADKLQQRDQQLRALPAIEMAEEADEEDAFRVRKGEW